MWSLLKELKASNNQDYCLINNVDFSLVHGVNNCHWHKKEFVTYYEYKIDNCKQSTNTESHSFVHYNNSDYVV